MTGEILLLAVTAFTIAIAHTALGPDHYIPFIALAKARKWGVLKTTLITAVCGLGHILSSVILGLVGIAIGAAVLNLSDIETFRGDIAAWLLIIFGFTYCIWGIHRALRSKTHKHEHVHSYGEEHTHTHDHLTDHLHIHDRKTASITPWVLFIIFLFGPCEPLIPLIMYPAAEHNVLAVIMVATIFGITTIATMLAIVLASYFGLSRISLPRVEKYSHALAGMAILLCGGAIKFLGL